MTHSIAHQWDQLWQQIGDIELMHIVPVDDLVGHEIDPDCVCMPYVEKIGKDTMLIAHTALDGRP